jgi:glucoside 3-dehydrogenase (cytochrome c) hitch-hiker subunit
MNRRKALKTVIAGGAFIASSGVLAACAREQTKPPTSGVLDRDEQDLMEEIADTLLPSTASSPGAKAAGVGPTINTLLSDCYKSDDQQRVQKGLAQFRDAKFVGMARAQREQFVRNVDAEARKAGDTHYFHLVRELANQAYWSSEIGMTKALRYIQTPGRFEGCIPLKPGQPAWG